DQTADAVVYRGYRNLDHKPVVVKLIKPDSPDRTALIKLRHEHAILNDLSLEGVVRTYGLLPHESSLALILEDPGGSALDALLQARKLDLTAALQVAKSLAVALEQLHRHGVIHKDVKPHNVMVRPGTWTATLI